VVLTTLAHSIFLFIAPLLQRLFKLWLNVNAVNFNDHVTEADSNSVEVNQTDDDDDVKADRPIPSHEERLRYLTALGVRIGDDACTKSELEQLTALTYKYKDIFATDYKDVPVDDVPPHTISLIDNKPLNQRRFRYNPTQERELENNAMNF